MTLLWIVVAALVVVIWAVTLVDIFKRDYTTGKTAAWVLLIVLLPIVGSLVYWAMRKPTTEEVEQARLAEADLRRKPARP